jgi:superfamily II DNA or RNA helicase
MLVLHAARAGDGSFVAWGERTLDGETATRPVRRRARAGGPAARLPFGATADDLRTALKRIGNDLSTAVDKARVVWLPTAGEATLASSPAIARAPPAGARLKLAPFAIDAVVLPFAAALDLFARLMDRTGTNGEPSQDGDAIAGDDLLAWVHALRFAASLVIRQRYLPGTLVVGDVVRSLWSPRIDGADETTLVALAAALPTIARAVTSDTKLPLPSGPKQAVRGFVEAAVDTLARIGAAEAVTLGGAPPAFAAAVRRRANVHDDWIASLVAADGELRTPSVEARALAAAIETWRRPLVVASPLRLVFRLEEPLETLAAVGGPAAPAMRALVRVDGAWTLRTLVRSQDDPSLIFPLEHALEAKGPAARALARGGVDVKNHVLVALAQAAATSPLVARSLRDTLHERVALTLAEAHAFLKEHAPALEQAGFQVLLPAWWTNRSARPKLAAHAVVQSPDGAGGGGLTLDTLVAVDWKLALGDTDLTLGELRALARLKAPLVLARGQWVEVDGEQLRAALTFLEAHGRERRSVRELLAMKLGAIGAGDAAALPVAGVTGRGTVGELFARLDGGAAFAEQREPKTFVGELRPYQRRGFSWMRFLKEWGLGACLADDMGLGKTIQTLALLQAAQDDGERAPALLVCPTSVVGNWQREASRFTPGLGVLVHHGGERARADGFARDAQRHALVVTSYALLHRDLEQFERVAWSAVILDEAQNVKNPETKQARAARSLRAGWRLALTGTPVENHVVDLWSIMEFLNPGLLGSHESFRREFFRPIQSRGDAEAGARLKRRTGPFLLRRLKSDPAIAPELPAKLEHEVICNLTREQASLYAAVVDAAQEKIDAADGIARRGLILALLTRLKQVCNHPAHFLADGSALAGRSGKFERLVEMLEEALDEGDRALVFTQYREMGELLERGLRERLDREVLFLHGGTPRKLREQMVARFQAPAGGPPLFVLSLKAGGTGLNLTRANHVFHFDRWWNPAVEDQATDRAHRIGQTQRVQVHKLVCAGTLEERIGAMIQRKKAIAEQVVGSGEAWLTELSTEQLRELVALGDDAVSE